MLNVASLVPEEKSTVLYLALGDLPVTYRPRLLVAIQEEQADEPDDEKEESEEEIRSRLAKGLCRVLVSWEIAGDVPMEDLPGHPKGSAYSNPNVAIPLDPGIVQYLTSPLLQEITMALNFDASPDAEAMGKRLQKRGRNPTSSRRS